MVFNIDLEGVKDIALKAGLMSKLEDSFLIFTTGKLFNIHRVGILSLRYAAFAKNSLLREFFIFSVPSQ